MTETGSERQRQNEGIRKCQKFYCENQNAKKVKALKNDWSEKGPVASEQLVGELSFFFYHKSTAWMILCKCLQEWIDEKPCVRGQRLSFRVFMHTKTDFARSVVLLLSIKFQVDSYLICRSEKNSCARGECVFVG